MIFEVRRSLSIAQKREILNSLEIKTRKNWFLFYESAISISINNHKSSQTFFGRIENSFTFLFFEDKKLFFGVERKKIIRMKMKKWSQGNKLNFFSEKAQGKITFHLFFVNLSIETKGAFPPSHFYDEMNDIKFFKRMFLFAVDIWKISKI